LHYARNSANSAWSRAIRRNQRVLTLPVLHQQAQQRAQRYAQLVRQFLDVGKHSAMSSKVGAFIRPELGHQQVANGPLHFFFLGEQPPKLAN
jgi:hypothetical protein